MKASRTVMPEAFSRIEQAFSVTLPDWHRLRVLDYPFSEPEHALYHNEGSIVRASQELLRDGWYGFPWPREFSVIGDTGFGDSYFIMPSTGDRRIFIAAHDGGPAPSFDELGEMVQAGARWRSISARLSSLLGAVATKNGGSFGYDAPCQDTPESAVKPAADH